MLEFPHLEFEKLNEAAVREQVISPFLQHLGYRSCTQYDIIYERLLRYPRTSLGRKNPERDPPLRGSADYILEINGLIRWVIEAKPPVPITMDDIQQAWTYANHPEVRAVYFVLCNGQMMEVFYTQHGPSAPAILSVSYEQLANQWGKIADRLSPRALLRDFQCPAVDTGLPIGLGLRSLAQITDGWIRYDYNSFNYTALNELQTAIFSGSVKRNEDGSLVAYMKTSSPIRQFQEFSERLGLAVFEMISVDSVLSTDPQRCSEFVNERSIIFPAGEPFLDISTWQPITFERNIQCETSTSAKGYLRGCVFSGRFFQKLRYLDFNDINAEVAGLFEVNLA